MKTDNKVIRVRADTCLSLDIPDSADNYTCTVLATAGHYHIPSILVQSEYILIYPGILQQVAYAV